MDSSLNNIIFDEFKIKTNLNKVNNNLKKYIYDNILPLYHLNDDGHNNNHVEYVLKRALEFDETKKVNLDILFTCVCYHDIACHINREEHELLSAKMAREDDFLNKYFSAKDLNIISEAIEDHRASLETVPRNIYGKILSSADRKIEIKEYLISSISFEKRKYPNNSKEQIIEASYEFAIKKFGENGYAIDKMYIDDQRYKKYLLDIQYLINNKEKFIEIADIVFESL